VKRFSIFAGTVGGLALAGTATAGLNSLSYDLVGEDLVSGTYTVHLYADVNAGDRLDAVYGNSDTGFMINMNGGASTYQNTTYGGPTSKSINSAFFAIVPSLEWDSYVTIGSLHSDGYPFGGNALQDIGIDWSGFEAGGDVSSDNGTWFVTPADPQGGEMGGRVLIAQFSIYAGSGDYDMMFSAGFQGKDASGVTWSGSADVMISNGVVPAPGARALLGLAGIAGRRRRRG
jgi:hypothetical protein